MSTGGCVTATAKEKRWPCYQVCLHNSLVYSQNASEMKEVKHYHFCVSEDESDV